MKARARRHPCLSRARASAADRRVRAYVRAMHVKEAKAVAHAWVRYEGCHIPGFQGAFLAGSVNWLPDDDLLSPTSDVDVMVVLKDPNPARKLGKFRYQGVLLEVSYVPAAEVHSPEEVLSDYHKAGSFRTPSVIADPSGQLSELQKAVAEGYAKRQWIYKRCDDARRKVLLLLGSLDPDAPFHDQVASWLFAAGERLTYCS